MLNLKDEGDETEYHWRYFSFLYSFSTKILSGLEPNRVKSLFER
jgi:hypothetical protein